MYSAEIIDAIRYVHILCFAAGIGTAILTEIHILGVLTNPIKARHTKQIAVFHKVIWGSVIGMWITGIALIQIRTGFALENFTPKLFAKIAVVSILTANALLVGRFALPMLRRAHGTCLNALPIGAKCVGGWVAAVSSASWLTALALGSSKVLAASGWSVLMVLIPGFYVTALVMATCVVIVLHTRSALQEKTTEDPKEFPALQPVQMAA